MPGCDWREGTDRVPHLPDVSTRFDCVREAVHEGGDHWIVVGRVEGFERGEGEPLVFENGDFAGRRAAACGCKVSRWRVGQSPDGYGRTIL